MTDTIGRRIFLSHLGLSYRCGRKITLAEFGELIAERLGRATPFTAAAVSRWEAGAQIPSVRIVEAIAEITETDPGWISHGARSAAPRPRRHPTPATSLTIGERELPVTPPAKKRAAAPRRRSR